MPTMAGWDGRERAMWRDHYGPLAGWLNAVTGDARVASAIADEAFVRAFSRWSLPRTPRRVLYADALHDLERRHGTAAWELAPDGWLGDLVRGLPPIQRRAVLLHHAGLSDRDVAGVLDLGSGEAVADLLALAERPAEPAAPVVFDLRVPRPRVGDAVSPERADERVVSVS